MVQFLIETICHIIQFARTLLQINVQESKLIVL